ncbi:hypothetical protein C0966_07295 [Bacillus methanolicus]|uniref:hypothetical protein n=1 Tax=Bacillus methanolicus TaxID=1471 RepID=UPI0023802C8A|nr:hypothetical protein [Bacillus methanolicus]MDE3839165.1 hypothetical protein [Bacillus methanolicus]
MKLATKIFLSMLLVFTVFVPFASNINQVSAAGKTVKECTGSGYTRTCTTYKVFRYNVYWTKSEVNKIVKKYEAKPGNIQLIIEYIVTLNPYTGVAKLFYEIGANNIIGDFKTAKKKKTGLRIQYDMYVPQTGPNIVKTKNYKRTFE